MEMCLLNGTALLLFLLVLTRVMVSFFVAKKGIFNKNPKVYKSAADVDADTSGDLSTKLKEALKYLPALGIKGVVQGDFLILKIRCKKEKD